MGLNGRHSECTVFIFTVTVGNDPSGYVTAVTYDVH